MKTRKRVRETTDPCRTALDTLKVEEVAPSTITNIKRSDKKLEIKVHGEVMP